VVETIAAVPARSVPPPHHHPSYSDTHYFTNLTHSPSGRRATFCLGDTTITGIVQHTTDARLGRQTGSWALAEPSEREASFFFPRHYWTP
jgi:hypothetical protein